MANEKKMIKAVKVYQQHAGFTNNAGNFPPLQQIEIPFEDLKKPEWTTLLLPTDLGVPLACYKCPNSQGRPPNNTCTTFNINIDADSPGFAKPIEIIHGDSILARTDGRDLYPRQVDVLIAFPKYELLMFLMFAAKVGQGMRESEYGMDRVNAIMALAKVEPEAFKDFFESYVDQMKCVDAPKWQKVKCPVYYPGCVVCGEEETEDGKVLMNCAACKDAQYCGKECQKKDWKEHKKICQSAA